MSLEFPKGEPRGSPSFHGGFVPQIALSRQRLSALVSARQRDQEMVMKKWFSQIAVSVNTGQRRSVDVNLRQPILLLLSDGNRTRRRGN
jgi:hypothetical protein